MIIRVTAKPGRAFGQLSFDGRTMPCALGRSGIVLEAEKQEGDGATPAGHWPLRRLLYRADRMAAPATQLSSTPIERPDGWCDAPGDKAYNCQVHLPYDASTESLWRDDSLYDLIIVLGHNDNPVVSGKGSAIFFHVAKETENEFQPTEGCVALPENALKEVLALCSSDAVIEIVLQP